MLQVLSVKPACSALLMPYTTKYGNNIVNIVIQVCLVMVKMPRTSASLNEYREGAHAIYVLNKKWDFARATYRKYNMGHGTCNIGERGTWGKTCKHGGAWATPPPSPFHGESMLIP